MNSSPVPPFFNVTLLVTRNGRIRSRVEVPCEFSETRGVWVRKSGKDFVLSLPFDVLANGQCENLFARFPDSVRPFFDRVHVTESWWIPSASPDLL